MRKILSFSVLILFLFSIKNFGQIVAWDVNGQSAYGTSPLTATTVAANVTTGGLTRGGGVTTSGTAALNAWGGNGWASTSAAGITGNQFVTFTITANAGYSVSFSSFNLYYRRSSTGPTNGLLQYQIGSGVFTNLATLSFSTSTSTGGAISPVDLTGVSGLQNVPSTSSVTFRIIPYGATGSSGTWYVYDTSGNDLSLTGTVNLDANSAPPAPVATAATNIGTTSLNANWNSSTGATDYWIDVSTASDFSSLVSGYNNKEATNVTTLNITSLNANTTYYYRVRASNGNGTSTNSNVISVGTSGLTIPTAPVATAATNITINSFIANWSSSSGATDYWLDVSSSSDFSNYVSGYSNKGVGNVTTTNVTSLNSNVTYYYRARASNVNGTSSNSNSISVTTLNNSTTVQFQNASGTVAKTAGTYNLVLTITNPSATNATQCQIAFLSASSSANTADINNYTTQTVTFPTGSSATQTVTLTIVNDGVTGQTKSAVFQIQNVTGGNSAAVGSQSQFTLSITDASSNDYYSTITPGLTGTALRAAIHNLIKNQTKYPYTDNSSPNAIDVWKMVKAGDEDPNNSNNVKCIYSGISYPKSSTGSSGPVWNREHTWAQSRGGFNTNIGPGTDAHHIRAEDATVNTVRSNKDFDNGGTPYPGYPEIKYTADTWEPPNAVKGDIARMLLYMDVRYEGDGGEPDLVLVDYVNGPTGTIGKLSTILAWNQQDPPDGTEMHRNDVIYSYQHNRNPFIDHPEWVSLIWGGAPAISNITRNVKVPDYNQNLTVTADISDNVSISNASLLYSVDGSSEQSVTMTNTTGTTYSGVIPETAYNDGNLLKYRILARDVNGVQTYSLYTTLFTGSTNISVLHAVDSNGNLNYNSYTVRVTGVATVSNNVFSTTDLETDLQDATGGLTIFKSGSASTTISSGRNYSATGSLVQVNGLAELVPDNVSTDIVDKGTGTNPEPTVVTIAQLLANPESYESKLIKIKNVTKTSGTWSANSNLNITDGTSSAITLKITGSTDLSTNPEPIWPKDIIGIFTQYKTSSPYTDGYQIKPRSINDFQNAGIVQLPSKPNLVSPPNNSVRISSSPILIWSVSSNATSYNLQLSSDSTFSRVDVGKNISSGATTNISNLSVNLKYFWRVNAQNSAGTSEYSDTWKFSTSDTLFAPSDLRLTTDTLIRVNILWKDNSSNELGFKIERLDPNVTQFIQIAQVQTDVTFYTDQNVQQGKIYKYRVRAFNNSFESNYTSEETITVPDFTLKQPTSLKAIANTNTIASLSWVDNSSNETGFIIFRATKSSMNFISIDTVNANITSFIDNTIYDGRKFYYKVAAFRNSTGQSETTNTDSVFFAMNPPTNFDIEQIVNQNRVKLNWKDNSKSEIGYKIERREYAQNNFSEIAMVGENIETYIDENVINNKTYSYRLRGYNDETQSNYTSVGAVIVNVQSNEKTPTEFAIYQNYPNPFNPTTMITYEIPQRSYVKIKIFDLIGKEIETLVNAEQETGRYELTFNAKDLPSGIYFYQIQTDEFTQTKKMILMK